MLKSCLTTSLVVRENDKHAHLICPTDGSRIPGQFNRLWPSDMISGDLSRQDYQHSEPQSFIRMYYEIVNPGLQTAQGKMKCTRRIGYKNLFVFTVCLIFPKISIHMSSDLATSSLVIVSAFALTCWIYLRQKRQQYRFPPGPSPKPIVGNALDVPSGKPWLTYMKWSKEFNSAFPFRFTVVVIYGSFQYRR